MSQNQSPGSWRAGTVPARNGCRLFNSVHGSGSTFFVPGFDHGSNEGVLS